MRAHLDGKVIGVLHDWSEIILTFKTTKTVGLNCVLVTSKTNFPGTSFYRCDHAAN